MGSVPLQPALPWRRPGRDLLHRAPSTEPQPIYPEASGSNTVSVTKFYYLHSEDRKDLKENIKIFFNY